MALALKINLADEGRQKTMRFTQDMTVGEVCKEVFEKTGVGGPDHGLFQAAGESGGRWLVPSKVLVFYQIQNNVSCGIDVIAEESELFVGRTVGMSFVRILIFFFRCIFSFFLG
jgi:hypothetical protein